MKPYKLLTKWEDHCSAYIDAVSVPAQSRKLLTMRSRPSEVVKLLLGERVRHTNHYGRRWRIYTLGS